MAIPREIKEGEREKDRELGATGGGRERESGSQWYRSSIGIDPSSRISRLFVIKGFSAVGTTRN